MRIQITALVFSLAVLQAIAVGDQRKSGLNEIQFDFVLGRLIGYSSHYQTKRKTSASSDGAVSESLTMNVRRGVADVNYELAMNGETWIVDLIEGREITIEHRNGDSEVTRLRQPREGNVSLMFQPDDQQHRYEAKSFWHLMLKYPDCREHLFELIHFLRPGLRIDKAIAQIETQLIHLAQSESPLQRDSIVELVKQMSSDRFVDRQAADRQLRQIGLAAFPLLDRINRLQLDAEQRMRIQRMMTDLTWQRSDSPGRIAQWLFNDPSVWLAMLARSNVSVRATAKTQLSRVCEQPIEFDVRGDEASRRGQIEALSKELSLD